MGGKGQLTSVMTMGADPSTAGRVPRLNDVTILGMDCGSVAHSRGRADDSILTADHTGLRVTVNGGPHPSHSALYDATRRVLHIAGVNGGLKQGALIEWGCGLGFPTT